MSSEDEINQYPIITYTNRLQREMEKITTVMSMYTDDYPHIVSALRMLINNLPPKARIGDLKADYNRLMEYDTNVAVIKNKTELEAIYMRIHDWTYRELFQDAFKFRPKNPHEAHIGPRATSQSP